VQATVNHHRCQFIREEKVFLSIPSFCVDAVDARACVCVCSCLCSFDVCAAAPCVRCLSMSRRCCAPAPCPMSCRSILRRRACVADDLKSCKGSKKFQFGKSASWIPFITPNENLPRSRILNLVFTTDSLYLPATSTYSTYPDPAVMAPSRLIL